MRLPRIATTGVLAAICLAFGLAAPDMPKAARNTGVKAVLLDEGKLPSFKWGVRARRDRGREGGRRPCLLVTILHRTPGFGTWESDDTTCGPLPRGGPPELLTYSFDEEDRSATIFVLAFEPRVTRVKLDFAEEETAMIRLKTLNPRQQELSGLRPFRHATLGMKGAVCIQAAQGYNEDGAEIYSDMFANCG